MIKNAKIALISLGIAILLLSGGCTKKYEDRLEGVWDWVDVVDINSEMTEEWHFIDYDFAIIRYLNGNPDSTWVWERGSFFLNWSLFGKTLEIDGTSVRSYNTEWDIIKLTDDFLIISNDIDGGILYKEYIKRSN